MVKSRLRKSSSIILQVFLLCIFLSGKTIKVPQDCSTIKQAVHIASDGDIVEVDDGFYFEKNIIIDKAIHLKSKNIFGAVIDGAEEYPGSIFIVRSRSEIEGFVLKNSYYGILQRNSPDVRFTAHDLAILDMIGSAICINDKEKNIGSAYAYNIMVDNVSTAFSTNDANRLRVENCLITNSYLAFYGSNHIEFSADKISILNCNAVTKPDFSASEPIFPATHQIDLGPDIHVLDDNVKTQTQVNFNVVIRGIFPSLKKNRPEGLSNNHLESMTIDILGDVYYRLGDYDKASGLFHAAADVGEKTGSLEVVWDANYGLAKIHEKRSDPQKSIAFYRKSISAIENFRNTLPLMEYKTAYMQSRLKVYESFLSLLFVLHKRYPSENYHEEAFAFVESFKARALLDSLHESDIDLKANLDPDTKNEINRIHDEISKIQKSLKKPGISQKERDILTSRLEQLDDSFMSLIVRIRTRYREFVNLIDPSTYTCEQVREKLLNDDTGLIEYYLGKDNSYVFFVTKQSLAMESLRDPESIRSFTEKYLHYLTLRNNREFKGINGGKRLFEELLGPFTGTLDQGIKRLIIIPDDRLLYLPFETLLRTGRGADGDDKKMRFLIEDFDIFYAPSSSTLIDLMNRSSPETKNMDLLAVGSDYTASPYPRLNNAVREAKAVAKLIKKKKALLLINDDATEEKIKHLDLNDFKILHFASHAILDNEKWHRSALILHPGRNSTEDDLLQPGDLFTLNLNSDLVVLSACDTRRGKLVGGEGIMGLTRMFLHSGARSVLSSLWKIDDRTSPEFMEKFYRYLTKGKNIDDALRSTKIEMLNSGHSHPRYWAAFILIGDPSPVMNR